MKPTQKQLEQLWENISDLFESNDLNTKQDIFDVTDDSSDLLYDILLECLDIMFDEKGNYIYKYQFTKNSLRGMNKKVVNIKVM